MRNLLLFATALFVLCGCLAATAVKTTGKVAGAAAGAAVGTTGKVVKGTVSLVASDAPDEDSEQSAESEDGQTNNSPEIDA